MKISGIKATEFLYGISDSDVNVPKEMKDAMANQLPVGRLGEDTEIANLICYLLSDNATFITGAIVPIDGGFTAQ